MRGIATYILTQQEFLSNRRTSNMRPCILVAIATSDGDIDVECLIDCWTTTTSQRVNESESWRERERESRHQIDIHEVLVENGNTVKLQKPFKVSRCGNEYSYERPSYTINHQPSTINHQPSTINHQAAVLGNCRFSLGKLHRNTINTTDATKLLC
jgi:hypothetical protein